MERKKFWKGKMDGEKSGGKERWMEERKKVAERKERWREGKSCGKERQMRETKKLRKGMTDGVKEKDEERKER